MIRWKYPCLQEMHTGFLLWFVAFWQRWGVAVWMVPVWASSNSVRKKKGFYASLALPEPMWM